MIRSTLVFLFFYIIVVVGLLSITIVSSGTKTSSFGSSFLTGSKIFVFIYAAADYRSSFNYLLIFGNTRKTIFISTMLANIALSLTMSVLTTLLSVLEIFVTNTIISGYTVDMNLIHLLYPQSNIATEFLFITFMYVMVSTFASIYGALAYKFGKFFIVPFWICFGISFLLIPATAMNEPAGIQQLIKAFFCLENPNGILLAPVNFLAAALIFSLGTYLISSRQPQTAPVQ
jgi:hypothetical protein